MNVASDKITETPLRLTICLDRVFWWLDKRKQLGTMKLVGCWTDGTILKQEDNCLMDSRQSFGVEPLSSAYLCTK